MPARGRPHGKTVLSEGSSKESEKAKAMNQVVTIESGFSVIQDQFDEVIRMGLMERRCY